MPTGIDTLTNIGNGLAANDGTGDTLRSGADKINDNNAAIVTAVNNLAASQSAGMISFLTKADMDADLAHAEGVLATVTNDPTDANNGAYRKSGASGSGSWVVTIDRATILKNDLASTATGKGASLVGFIQTGTGAVARTVQDKACDVVSVGDYDTVAHAVAAATNKPIIYADGSFGGIVQTGNKNEYRNLIGVLRNDGTGWAFINDTGHASVGFDPVTPVSIVGNAIRISYNFTASHVGSLLVVPDETFALLGITAGGSVGNGFTDIFIASPLQFTVNCATGAIATTSIFSGLITASSTNGITTVLHPSCTAKNPPLVTNLRQTSGQPGAVATCGYADTATYIEHNMVQMGGIASYSGSVWGLTTDMDVLRSPVTFAWDATNSELAVTHPAAMNAYDVQMTSRGLLNPRISTRAGTITSTTFRVKFYDATNTLVTTQSSDMNFCWSRPGLVKSTVTSPAFYSVDRGYAELDPAQLISTTGNFWIYGVMESAAH